MQKWKGTTPSQSRSYRMPGNPVAIDGALPRTRKCGTRRFIRLRQDAKPKTTRTGSLKSSGPFGRPTNSGSYYCDGGGSGLLAAGGIDASHREGPDEGLSPS